MKQGSTYRWLYAVQTTGATSVGVTILCLIVMIATSEAFVYPRAKITIKVIDEESGQPLAGADAGASFSTGGWSPKHSHDDGKTNKDGIYVANGKGIGIIHVGADTDGYYKSNMEYTFDHWESFTKVRHTPWNPTVTLVMRKKVNPTSMYAKRVFAEEVKVLDKGFGYDLIEGDWVSPYGDGNVSDLVFTVRKKTKEDQSYTAYLEVTFSNKYDGIYAYPIEENMHSELLLPSVAPQNGYVKTITSYSNSNNKDLTDWNKDQHFYIRVRSVVEDSKLTRAMYGKIYHGIKIGSYMIGTPDKDKLPKITFEYYLNPDWTRNTEFDPMKNLFEHLGVDERIRKP